MRVFTLLCAFLGAALPVWAESHTVPIFWQPVGPSADATPASFLAEIIYDTVDDSSAVTNYEPPELPAGATLLRIGTYDKTAKAWASSTTVLSVDNFSKGYSPHFLLTVDDRDGDGGSVISAACRGVMVDAGHTRDFGPQAAVAVVQRGKQPDLNKPVVLSPEGRKVVPEERSFLQKYWWALAIGAVFLMSGGGPQEK